MPAKPAAKPATTTAVAIVDGFSVYAVAIVDGFSVYVPEGALAFKYADAIEGARWIRDEGELARIRAEDPSLVAEPVTYTASMRRPDPSLSTAATVCLTYADDGREYWDWSVIVFDPGAGQGRLIAQDRSEVEDGRPTTSEVRDYLLRSVATQKGAAS